MIPALRPIVVLGAPGTGADNLRTRLREALSATPDVDLSDDAQPTGQHGFALLMGLDLPCQDGAQRSEQARIDALLREQLQALGLAFRVVYGVGPDRLTNALLALGLPAPDRQTRETREAAQFDLNRGRTPWSCEKCSDPDCEHRLFTGLLRQTTG